MPDLRPVDPLNPYPAGPATPLLEHGLRILERQHNDKRVTDALGRIKKVVVDAASGLPVPCYVYRLECGHLVSIWNVPLPGSQRVIYCAEPGCADDRGSGRDRLLVELLTPDGAL